MSASSQAEDDDDGAEEEEESCRVVKRCLHNALMMNQHQREFFIHRAEELVRSVSRLMHHGSILATHYVLHLYDRETPPTDEMLTDQTFFRSCMMYTKTTTRSGAYPDVKRFADENRRYILDTATVSHDGNCVNAAAKKLKTSVMTMLREQFTKRITTIINALFRGHLRAVKASIRHRIAGFNGGEQTVLERDAWLFIDEMRRILFYGVNSLHDAVENIVAVYGRAIAKTDKPVVVESLLRRGVIPPDVKRVGKKMTESAKYVNVLLPLARKAIPPSSAEILAAVSGFFEDESAVIRAIDAATGEGDAPDGLDCLVSVVRSLFYFRGKVTKAWIKRHPSRALNALQFGRQQMESIERGKTGERSKKFALLPIFGMKRQMVTLDADTLLSILKKCGLLSKEAKRSVLTPDFMKSIFRIPNKVTMTDKVSVETDGVAVVLRLKKHGLPSELPRAESVRDWQTILADADRCLFVDPGINQPVTIAEWKPGIGVTKKQYRMTAKEYYNEASVKQRTLYRKKRDSEVDAETAAIRKATLKTSSLSEYRESLEIRMAVAEALWNHTLGRWTSRLRMKAWMKKRSAVDRFWVNKIGLTADRTESRTVVVFGDGSFSCTMRGKKHAAPLRQIEKAAGRFSRLAVKISERYTTKVCSRCHMPTVGVRRDVNGRHVVVQESRYCHSQTCHSAPFKARDYDATLSIGEVFMAMVRGEERPECYTKAGYDARKEELRGQGIDTRDVIIP
nr:Transposase associated protein [Oceanusvirus sp.]WRJ70082.1 Transposase associated protein [Oceanusvirus sp.]